MRRFAFKNRLFIAYATLTGVVVIAFAIALIQVTASINRETELNHQREVVNNNRQAIENILWQMDSLASQVMSNNELINRFIPLTHDGDSGNYFSKNLLDFIWASSQLATINVGENRAARISAFNLNGDYVSAGTLYETPEVIEATLSNRTELERLTELVMSDEKRRHVLEPHDDMWSNNPDARIITLLRALSSTYTSKSYGLLAVQQSVTVLDDLEFFRQDEARQYALLNAKGEKIYPQDKQPEGYAPLYHEAAQQPTGELTTFRHSLGGARLIVIVTPVEPSNMLLVRVMPESQLNLPYAKSYWMMSIVSFLLLIILLWVVYVMADRISRPLRALAGSIGGVNLNHMELNAQRPQMLGTSEELVALDDAFRAMLKRLQQSIGLEMRAYMFALQSQMNPHFLYNMLSVIVESAEADGSTRTVSMCLKLSAMLRYIADYNGDSATLADELTHMRNYLDLMKDRYEDNFSYTVEADEGAGRVSVPKLILQPLAENCFKHGFRDSRPPWRISVRCEVRGSEWTVTVRDNGRGMTQEEIETVQKRIETYRGNLAANYPTLRLGSMGLVNTVLRLTLLAHQPVRFEIENLPDGLSIMIGGHFDDTCADCGG
jgi:sensor histidine kinase YesM